MCRNQLILLAMLVSCAISQTSEAADKSEYILQRQQAKFDTSAPSSELKPEPTFPRVAAPRNDRETEHTSQALPALNPDSKPSLALERITANQEPSKQTTTFSPPQQIAMTAPAFTQDDLVKALNNWSSVLTVEFVAPLTTRTAKVGDVVETKLVQDFRWGPQLIAARDSLVRGHVTGAESARTLTRSALSTERTLKSRGRLSIQFDEIIDQSNRVWPIQASPSPRQKNNTSINRSTQRFVEVDAEGRIVKAEAGLAGGLKATSNAAKVATMVPLPGTMVFTALAPAVAMGAVGAASPEIAYDKPVDTNDEHRRAKGAAYGFLTNLPGAFVVRSVVEKGSEISLMPGDQLTLNVCIKDTGYRLPPGQQLNVNGKIMNRQPTKRLYPAGQQSAVRPAI